MPIVLRFRYKVIKAKGLTNAIGHGTIFPDMGEDVTYAGDQRTERPAEEYKRVAAPVLTRDQNVATVLGFQKTSGEFSFSGGNVPYDVDLDPTDERSNGHVVTYIRTDKGIVRVDQRDAEVSYLDLSTGVRQKLGYLYRADGTVGNSLAVELVDEPMLPTSQGESFVGATATFDAVTPRRRFDLSSPVREVLVGTMRPARGIATTTDTAALYATGGKPLPASR